MSASKIKNAAIEAHDALAEGVYLVNIFLKENFIQHGIFSDFTKAKGWMESFPSDHTCTCIPFVLDNPDYGITPKEQQN